MTEETDEADPKFLSTVTATLFVVVLFVVLFFCAFALPKIKSDAVKK